MSLKQKSVLVIGRHPDMLEKITRLLMSYGYRAIGEFQNEQAVATFKAHSFDAVIIGGGVDSGSRNYFQDEFLKLNAGVKIIDAHPQTVLTDLANAFSENITKPRDTNS